MNSRIRIPEWLLLLAFCAFFFLRRLSAFGLIGADEPRYAQIAREMLERHDWITPTLSGLPWLEKPPLYYWQAMVAYRLFGVSDWAARLPSVVDASGLVFAVYLLLRRLRPGCALDAALMLACSAGIVGFGRAASTDIGLAAMFAIAMLAWYAWCESGSRRQLLIFYICLALAMLAKGPVGPFLAVAIIVVFALVRRDWRLLQRTAWIPGILTFCAVALPWYISVQIRNPQFFRVFILEHNLARFGSNVFHHPEPFWYFVPVMLLGWVPWTVFVIAASVWAARRLRAASDDPVAANPFAAFLSIWIAVIVVFFSFSQSKLPGYVLPAFPPGIILLASHAQERLSRRLNPALAVIHAAVAALLVFAALLSRLVILQHRLEWNSSLIAPAAISAIIGAAVGAVIVKVGWPALRNATTVPALIAMTLALRFAAPALDETFSARPLAEALSHIAPRQLPVAGVLISRETEYGLQFYRNQPVPRYELRQAPAGEHLLIAAKGFRNAFAKNVPGRRIEYLGDFPAQNLEFFYIGP